MTVWKCQRCRSGEWVGWRAGPAHEGFTRYAQCVRCGQVQDLPEEEIVMPMPDDSVTIAEQFNAEAEARAAQAVEDARHVRIEEMARRFHHHPPTTPAVIQAHEQARALGEGFARWLMMFVPNSPERDKALDALDLTVMHANAAIARTQLEGAWHVGTLPELPSV